MVLPKRLKAFVFAFALFGSGSLIASDYEFVRIAGHPGGWGAVDATGIGARFEGGWPHAFAIDSEGNFYLGESSFTVRKVAPDATVTTLAGRLGMRGRVDAKGGQARFSGIDAIAVDEAGNVFVAEPSFEQFEPVYVHHPRAIRRISPAGDVTTFATGSNLDIGSMTVGPDGAIYFVKKYGSKAIYRLADGEVTVFAGSEAEGAVTDGSLQTARFSSAKIIVKGADGALYVADEKSIRRIAGGTVSTLAKFDPAPDGLYISPSTLAVTPEGAVFTTGSTSPSKLYHVAANGTVTVTTTIVSRVSSIISDSDGNLWGGPGGIQRLNAEGDFVDFAGLTVPEVSADGSGDAARFSRLSYRADLDVAGNLVSGDLGRIVRITPAGLVTTVKDGLQEVDGVAVAPDGTIYYTETMWSRIMKLAADGTVSVFAGQSGRGYADGVGGNAKFNNPAIAVDEGGVIWVADEGNHVIRKVTPDGTATTFAGLAGSAGDVDGTGADARLRSPRAIAVGPAGHLFVLQGNGKIRIVTSTAVVTTRASLNYQTGYSIATDEDGNAFVCAYAPVDDVYQEAVVRVAADGTHTVHAPSLTNPLHTRFGSIAVASSGSLFLGDGQRVVEGRTDLLADVATIDQAEGAVGVARSLDLTPSTATSWEWTVVRRPSGSIAQLSSTSVRNPTFTPDVADLYVFRVIARSAGGIRSSEVSLMGVDAGVETPVGTNVEVESGEMLVTFSAVTAAGMTNVSPLDLASAGFAVDAMTAVRGYDITTTAIHGTPITVCFTATDVTDPTTFGKLRVFHKEGGVFVDRTASRDFATKRVCASVTSLSPFILARAAYLRGDANGDDNVGTGDIFYLINNLFAAGPAPLGNGDANSDGNVGPADIFLLINHIFAGGAAPLARPAGTNGSFATNEPAPVLYFGAPRLHDGVMRVPVYCSSGAVEGIAFRILVDGNTGARVVSSLDEPKRFEAFPTNEPAVSYVVMRTWSGAEGAPIRVAEVELSGDSHGQPVSLTLDPTVSVVLTSDGVTHGAAAASIELPVRAAVEPWRDDR